VKEVLGIMRSQRKSFGSLMGGRGGEENFCMHAVEG
jgi:hypothetical protein